MSRFLKGMYVFRKKSIYLVLSDEGTIEKDMVGIDRFYKERHDKKDYLVHVSELKEFIPSPTLDRILKKDIEINCLKKDNERLESELAASCHAHLVAEITRLQSEKDQLKLKNAELQCLVSNLDGIN